MAIFQQAERGCSGSQLSSFWLCTSPNALFRALRNSGYKENRIWLILNRILQATPTLSPEEIEDLIGLPVFYVIPDDSTGCLFCARGELLSHASPPGGNFSRFRSQTGGPQRRNGTEETGLACFDKRLAFRPSHFSVGQP